MTKLKTNATSLKASASKSDKSTAAQISILFDDWSNLGVRFSNHCISGKTQRLNFGVCLK